MSLDYSRGYANALKRFARAPEQGIGSFINSSEGQPVHHQNPHDLALADYLQDHDDPRHLLVQRHLEGSKHYSGSKHLDAELEKRLGPEFESEVHGEQTFETPDGDLAFLPYTNVESGQRAILGEWLAKHPSGGRSRLFQAVLSPAEHAHMVKSLAAGGVHSKTSDQLPVDLS